MNGLLQSYGWTGTKCGGCGGAKWTWKNDSKPEYIITTYQRRGTFKVEKLTEYIAPSGNVKTKWQQVHAGRDNQLESYLQTI